MGVIRCRPAASLTLAVAVAIPTMQFIATPEASAAPVCTGSAAAGQTVTCSPSTAGYATYVVPAHVTSISVVADGGGGGKNAGLGNGGSGARVSATLAVTPGQQVKIAVGAGGGAGLGGNGNTGGLGYGNGGNGGPYYGEGFGGGYGGGGGGSSAVLIGGTVKVVAGGGGGGGQLAGGSSTQNGSTGGGDGTCSRGGGGGAGGVAGGTSGTGVTTAATGGLDGRGGSGTYGAGGTSSGGGGGGGGYGGGGPGNWNGPYGCSNSGGGGGGGSYVAAGATAVTYGSAGNAGGVATSGAGGSGQVTVTFIATPTVPGAVTGLELTDITSTAMTAYWTPPADDGGSALIGYDVTVGATTTRTTDPLFALTGLTSATSYTVNVKAVNAQGSSTNASATATTATPAATVPGAPTGPIGFSSVTSIAITASWAAPASSGGSPVLGYQVQVDGGSRTWTTSTTYTADFLTPHASHTFAVYAVNAVGASAALTGTQATGPTVPGTPTDLTFSAVTDTSITANWTPPTDNGGAAIDGYFIAVDGGASIPLSSSTTSYTKTGLTAQTWYSFTVNAHNSQGNSGDLTGSQTTSAAANAPLLATTPATVGTSNAVTLTNYPGAEAETVYVNAPDGSVSTLTLTTSAGGSGSVAYTPTMAGTYTITTAPTPRTATSLTSNAPTPGGGGGGGDSAGGGSSSTATPATPTSSAGSTPVITPSIGTGGVAIPTGPQRVMRVIYAYSGGAWRPVSGRARAIPAAARVTVVTATTPASMRTRHLARAMRFARTLSTQVHRRTSARWHGPAVVVVTWRVPAPR